MTSVKLLPAFRWTAVAGVAVLACAPPVPPRLPVPAPFPLIGGATPIPGKGAGIHLELSDALRGQEVGRGELTGVGFSIGAADVFSGRLTWLETHDHLNGFAPEAVGVFIVHGKVRLGRPFGPRSVLALHAATATSNRYNPSIQDDRLRTVDVGATVEFLLNRPEASGRISFFAGPRLIHEHYQDRIHPSESFQAVWPGVLGGVHISIWALEIFAETTTAYVPRNTYLGKTYGGRITVIPALAVMIRFGRPYPWPGRLDPP